MNDKIIIAIDGYSSCGKSTFAKSIAAKLGYIFIDSGALYRMVTLAVMRNDIESNNKEQITKLLPSLKIGFRFNSKRMASDAYLGDECVEDIIRTLPVSNNVSSVSTIATVRTFVVDQLQAMGKQKGIVMDGRDIGTTVFPSAELKLFMTASVDVRAMRRYKELKAKGDVATLEEIKENIATRDYQDETRAESPLRRAEDAILLDNSTMSIPEQMVWFEELMASKFKTNL